MKQRCIYFRGDGTRCRGKTIAVAIVSSGTIGLHMACCEDHATQNRVLGRRVLTLEEYNQEFKKAVK